MKTPDDILKDCEAIIINMGGNPSNKDDWKKCAEALQRADELILAKARA